MAQQEDDETQGGESAEAGALDLQSTLDTALELVERQARQHPFRTVGVAMGVGYVLGGGLPKFLVRLGMLAAGRMLTDAITAEGLRTLVGNAADDDDATTTARSRGHNGHHRKRAPARERQARS